MTSAFQDLRYGFRTLRRAPGFTAIAVAVLALGIGANATVFSLANALFFRPLPVADQGTLVRAYSNLYSNTSYRWFEAFRERQSTLSGLAAFKPQSFGIRIDADVEPAFGTLVTGDYFPVIGVRPSSGRVIVPSDDRAGVPPVVVLSHAFWTKRFASAPDVVGRTMFVNDQAFTIVGVADKAFTGLMSPLVSAFWVPLATDALLRPGIEPSARLERTSVIMIGRLKPGTDVSRAHAEFNTIGRQLLRDAGAPDREQAASVYPATTLHVEFVRPVAAFTGVLMALVGLVLLIVCVNVANLVLARAAGRQAELSVRQSLGAGRGRLVRQLLTENLLLSLGGAAIGVAIAYWTTRFLMSVPLPAPVPVALDLSVDVRVLLFTIAVAMGATLAFGVMPALTASRVDLVSALRGGADGGRRLGRLRGAFLVAQVSLSVVLLVAAGLFVRSFRHLAQMDTGFDAARVLTATIDLDTRGYTEARGRAFLRDLTERLEAAPGIESVNSVDIVPVTLSNTTIGLLRDTDAEPPPGHLGPMGLAYTNTVGPGHFRTLHIGIVAGRDFSDRDDESAPRVAIVNETFARRYWPDGNAVGRRLRVMGDAARSIEVIGVARDSKYVTVAESPTPFVYLPMTQAYQSMVTVLVRAAGPATSALPAIKQELRTLDPGLSIQNVQTLEEATSISLLPARIAGNLLGVLGLLALALAALGIYGVLSFLVRARTREIGIRVALGARPGAVAAMVVRQAMRWTVIGGAIGLVLSFALTRVLASFLYGISATDAITFGSVVLLLGAVAALAALVPAVRASRLNPLAALRTF